MTALLIVLALLVCGMVLLVAEIAVLPGFGVAGVGAIVLLASGVAYAWHSFGPGWGVGSLLIAAAGTAAVIVLVPRTKAGKDLVLGDSIKGSGAPDDSGLIGQEGVTLTPLRPAGVAEIAGRRLDVIADGMFVEAGQKVRVVSVEGARIVVALSEGGA
jgi:membrane-bound serine protease (ClpP class)